MKYYRDNPDEPIIRDWYAGASGYSSSDMDKLQNQEPLPKPTGKHYSTVDELVDKTCSDEVEAEYYRLQKEPDTDLTDSAQSHQSVPEELEQDKDE